MQKQLLALNKKKQKKIFNFYIVLFVQKELALVEGFNKE